MNKKRIGVSVLIAVCLGIGFSCSIFEPDTNLGKDIINSVDTTVINLKNGFAKLDSVYLTVSGAPSNVVVAGPDTSTYLLQSGVHSYQIVAGRIGDDSAVAYAEFHVSSAILTSLRAACSTSKADSVYLLLSYDPSVNDITLPDSMVTVQVFSCQRKYYPRARNDFTTPDFTASAPLSFSRKRTDTTFSVALGADIVSLLTDAVADTATYVPHSAKTDTVIGTVKSDITKPVRPDTLYFPADTVLQSFSHTVVNVRSITGLTDTIRGDTAIIRYQADSETKTDTLLFTDSIFGLTFELQPQDTSAIIRYTALRFRKIIQTLVYDSTDKYIGAVHIYASAGGGVVRFIGPPVFLIKYRASCIDTARQSLSSHSLNYYFDMTVTEFNPIPSDSLVASWQADRFVEIPVDLTPVWQFATGGENGITYKIIQHAACYLNASLFNVEKVGADSTQRKIVYGLLDHRITGSRSQSIAARDSLKALCDAGRVANDSVSVDALKVLDFPARHDVSPEYARREPKAGNGISLCICKAVYDFGRVVIRKPASVRFSAFFSNPQK